MGVFRIYFDDEGLHHSSIMKLFCCRWAGGCVKTGQDERGIYDTVVRFKVRGGYFVINTAGKFWMYVILGSNNLIQACFTFVFFAIPSVIRVVWVLCWDYRH